MRSLFLIIFGFLIAVICGVSLYVVSFMSRPLSAVTNLDYPLVQVSRFEGKPLFELHKGESKLLEYGEYTVYIPEIKASFVLFKNNRGKCDIHSADGVLLVEVNENASILNPSKDYNKR